MRTPASRFAAIAQGGVLAVVLSLGVAGIWLGTPPAQAAPAASALRQQLEHRYEAFSISNGVLLRARQERLGVRTVEVSGDAIVVNGAKVGPEVLRSWMGDGEAELILKLQELPPGDRQELFGFKRTAGKAPAATESTGNTTESTGKANESTGKANESKSTSEGAEAEKPEAEAGENGKVPTPPEPPEAPAPPRPSVEAPAPPSIPTVNTGSRVKFGGGVTVERNEVADDVVAFGGPVHVEGEVSHDVIAFGGSARINGRVGGDVRVFGGSVHLGPHAEVMGDVSAAGGTVSRESGSQVHGAETEARGPFPGWNIWVPRGDEDFHRWPFVFFPLGIGAGGRMLGLLMGAALISLVLLVARGSFERVDFEITTQFWQSLLAGFLAQIVFLPLLIIVTVVLIISVVGCALLLLYPVIFVGLLLMALVGFAAACHRTGRLIEDRFSWQFGHPWVATLVGFFAIEIWSVIGSILRIGGFHMFFIAQIVALFGVAVRYVAVTAGFGGALLAYFRYRRIRRSGGLEPPVQVTPPPPPAGPIFSSVAAPPSPAPPQS